MFEECFSKEKHNDCGGKEQRSQDAAMVHAAIHCW